MTRDTLPAMERREFLKLASAAGLSGFAPMAFAADGRRVTVLVNEEDATAMSIPVARAFGKLKQALANQPYYAVWKWGKKHT